MATKCLIRFDDNPNKVFFGGQLIVGTVVLTLTKEQPVKAVFVEVTGVAKCRWCEHIQQKRMTYRGTEVYLYARKYFVGGPVSSVNAIDTDTDAPTTANTSTNVDENSSATGSGRGDTSAASATSTTAASSSATIRLQPGEHVYTFTCTLPANLPTSFEGTFGNIRYRAEVTVNVPLWPDKTFAEGFTVIRSVDLNALPDVRLRSHVERSDMFHSCCLLPCLQPKLIRLQASVARTGYTSGQTFEVAVAMENNSDISVRSLTVSLLRVIIYCANERGNQHKTEHVRYSTVRTAGCKRQTVQQLRVLLQVPAGPPTDANSSRICKIRYEVEVRSDVGNCHDFPVARLPITIGTFPLLDSVPADDPRVSVISYDPDLPSYEQAIAMNAPNDINDPVLYSPVYPVYEPTSTGPFDPVAIAVESAETTETHV